MITKRIIPCLDVNNGRVVKGVNFVNLIDAGDPVEIAAAYDKAGADEVVFLDITASSDARATKVDMVRRVAEKVFIPFTVGGGIRTVDDFRAILREGADKVAVNSAAIMNPSLISEAAEKFGSQCVVVAIDAKRTEAAGISTKTAAALIWGLMLWSGQSGQVNSAQGRYCSRAWIVTGQRTAMTLNSPEQCLSVYRYRSSRRAVPGGWSIFMILLRRGRRTRTPWRR